MGIRRYRKLAILHKLETVYGTDAVPTAAEGMMTKNVTFTPLEGEEVSRDLLTPYMGNQGVQLAGIYARLEFDLELAGSGTAGTAPKYASILRAAGFAQALTAGTKAEYTIVEDATESSSLYFISEKVQHVLFGGQCNLAFNIAPKAIPTIRVTYMGMLGTITDIASMPAVSQVGWTTPLIASKANTTMSLHGWTAVAESLSVDLGNTVTPRFLIGDARMLITDRKSTGSAVVEARSLAEIDWFSKAKSRARGPLSLVHGITAGNIVELAAPAVEIGKPTQGQTDGIVNYSLPLSLCPVSGLDELKLIIR